MSTFFKYATFFSYRRRENLHTHQDHDDEMRFVELLYDAISSRTNSIIGLKAFRDANAITLGDKWDPTIQQALCKSVCMVAFYTPTFIDKDKPYCARELKGILHIEQERATYLNGNPNLQHKGLVIPLFYYCKPKHIIPELNSRQGYFLDDFWLSTDHKRILPEKKFNQFVLTICHQIDAIHDQLKQQALTPCNQFDLPSAKDIQEWIEKVPRYQIKDDLEPEPRLSFTPST